VAKKAKKEQKSAAESVVDSFKLTLAKDLAPVQFVSTGVKSIDRICGGGIPKGRIVEVYGPYSAGKTLLCQSLMVQVEKLGGWSVFIDREHALDVKFAERTGVNLSKVYYEKKKKTVEEIFDYLMWSLQTLRQKHPTALIAGFIDSIAAANTRKELERKEKMGDQEGLPAWDRDMGNRAKVIGEGLRKLSGIMDENMIVVIVNQVRSKVGVVYGNPETTTGGQALPYYASVRLRLQQGVFKESRNEKQILDGKRVIGVRAMVTCTKNKVSAPFRKAETVQSFEFGFLEWAGLYEVLLWEGVIEETKRGVFRCGGDEMSKDEFRDYARRHPELVTADVVTMPEVETDEDEQQAAHAEPDEDGVVG
jgi:recombination protein RecA